MVLKNILLTLSLITFSYSSMAMDEEQQKLEFLFKRADYENLIAEVSDIEEDSSWQENYLVFEYKALAMEKTDELEEAIKIYKTLLKKNFGKQTSGFIRSALSGKEYSLDFEDSQRMKFYFGKLTELFVKRYEQVNRSHSAKVRKSLYKKAMTFIKLIRNFDDEGELPEVLKERVIKKTELLASYTHHSNWYPILSFMSWQDNLVLNKDQSSVKSTILNTSSGSCSGLGVRWKNKYYEWNIENCYLLGKSTVSTSSGDLSYSQSAVSTSGLYGGLGLMNHSIAKDLSFGAQLNYLYRKGNWVEPDETTLSEVSYMRYGFSIRTAWNIERLSFVMSLGKIFKNESSLFQLATHYHF